MNTYTSISLNETAAIAHDWLQSTAKNPNTSGATIAGLSGHLGAGKTAFVKCVAKELGISEEVTSPTFVIMKIYPIEHAIWKKMIHIDAYRLENPEELKAINFNEMASDPKNLILMEWPENVELYKVLPGAQGMNFELKGEVRHISF
ncbi:MAG: tRNA (adenosine(37)-N6)-threonylcarbamoyltransferase complex ATPase subunit type 1 TsaE [bacterium]|nr:tRNA (adenosine(37)-N6)-threonylcarbamoyltransferase complex ATPase subunit type 1 TsaE [bacterium]